MPPETSPLRVGIVGANPDQSWAKDSHVPAIRALPDLTLAAVATRSEASARGAANAFGAPHAFADAFAMIASDAIDIVAVCVKVPDHRKLVLAALAAGKHVMCEWPTGKDAAEAEELAAAAAKSQVHVAADLEARANPALKRAREMVQNGAIGRPLSARILSTTMGWGPHTLSAYAYLDDPASGATMTTITAGHTLDAAAFVLGEIESLDALGAIQYESVAVADTGKSYERKTPDHLLVLARHAGGCVTSVSVVGGRAPDASEFAFEVVGTSGRLTLTGGDTHGFQAGELTLKSDCDFATPDEPVAAGLPVTAVNVAETYAQFARDIRSGARTVPDFAHAAKLTRLLDAVTLAAASGARQRVR